MRILNFLVFSIKYNIQSWPIKSQFARDHSIFSTPKIALNRSIKAIRSAVFELPFFVFVKRDPSVQYKTNQALPSGPDTPHITRYRKGSPVKYESQDAEEFGTAVGPLGDPALEGVESVAEEAELRSAECFF